jgi:hypothetical protein
LPGSGKTAAFRRTRPARPDRYAIRRGRRPI